MSTELDHDLHRFEIFARQVLAPAVFTDDTPLDAEVFQCRDPVPFDQAARQSYRRVDAAFRWGPIWSTAWFRIEGRVPASMAGRTVVLRFSTGTEATLWRDGLPVQGLDLNHEFARLFEPARGGEVFRLYVEAACNRPFGVLLFPWESPEEHRRWAEPDPGRLERCSLAVLNDDVWRLWQTYEFARQLLKAVSSSAPSAARLRDALQQATQAVDVNDVAGSVSAAMDVLQRVLSGATAPATRCVAVGHAHIDTAWLWPLRESRRKCIRTFSTVLRLMERHAAFRFVCSQAQQYAWIEQDAPGLFERIAQRVREGRWEPGGAMWVEPDCNLPCGESLVRQIIHGTAYWREKFGEHGRQTYLYLPDTFGFCPALPQIMAQTGLETFLTNKLWWNDTDEFPHLTFLWRGLDGSEVLAHCMPGADYNSDHRPEMLIRGEQRTMRLGHPECRDWLQPYGYGDGGGGPNESNLLFADLAKRCPDLPAVEHDRVDAFCRGLHERRAALRRAGQDLPRWDGELYLQYHRGTYTTQAWLKRANRELESALHCAEWIAFFAPCPPAPEESARVMDRLHNAWRLLLLNQFHDILPGSSIAEVYDDARRELAEVRHACDAIVAAGLPRWISEVGGGPSVVFNPRSVDSSDVIDIDGQPTFVSGVPALGYAPLAAATSVAPPHPVQVEERRLSNGLVDVRIDDAGRVADLIRLDGARSVCRVGSDGRLQPLNQLVLYDDVPGHYDAWEIARHDRDPGRPVCDDAETIRVVERHPLRGAIEVERPIGRCSRLVQRYILRAGSPRVDLHTRIEWRESRTLLRALFPVAVRARAATYETAFGCIERPTTANTSWERAMFEVPAHRWMDLSEPGLGVALLNDAKYGHSCHGHVMGLSLLRSPAFPDPTADRGRHEFTYALMPHAGDWRAAGVDRQAEALNRPLFTRPASPGSAAATDAWRPFRLECSGGAGIEIVAAKRAEADDRLILRLVETRGGRGRVRIAWSLSIADVSPVDLLEQPSDLADFRHERDAAVTSFAIRPFQICSLAVTRSM